MTDWAVYACRPDLSRGRLIDEPSSPTRSVYQRDRDRIVHSGAFRKLEYKTQVFIFHEGDYYRTRLTHSLEVAQIARSIARVLRLDEDLVEAIALAHDLGHTPFGHAGEAALAHAMAPWGGFSHNDQTVRVVTRLEQRYAAFDGLNLTWETLEGVVKHNGPLIPETPARPLTPTVREVQAVWDLALDSQPGLEAQVAALADDIAYTNHDLDDGLRAGLFSLDEVADQPLVGPILAEVRRRHPDLAAPRVIHETIRRLIDHMVSDLLAETRRRLAALAPASPEQIRRAGRATVAFGADLADQERRLRQFLFQRMYRHYRVNRMMSKSARVVRDLFALFMAEPNCLPTAWQPPPGGDDDPARARLVADYIAGMTDRYALIEHGRLFDLAGRS